MTYWINEDNSIIHVSDDWNTFSRENGTVGLTDEAVIGKSLFGFVRGEETRMLLDVLFRYVRTMQKSVKRPYRCDSPTLKRYMEMHVTPEVNGKLRIDHMLLRSEPQRHAVDLQFVDVPVFVQLHRCSFCNRFLIDGTWVEAEHLKPESKSLATINLVCPDCAQQYRPG